MRDLLEKGSILILIGTGGVGKTTVAAALGLAAAERLNTALITVDPTRRLRDALGLSHLGGSPTRLSERALRAAGLKPGTELSAMQLDVKGEWDAMMERFVRNPDARQRILNNPFYRSLTSQYPGSEAYAALQQLYDLHQTAAFDIEIVDTPPAAHAFEFLQAPARLARLLDSRSARWLFTPSLAAGRIAMRLASQAARFVVRELERFAGANVLTTISDFFAAASEAVDGMVDRMHKTQALLHSPSVHFVLVTTAEEDRLRRARDLAAEMERHELSLDAIVINRFLDEETFSAAARDSAAEAAHFEALRRLPAALHERTGDNRGLGALINYLEDYQARRGNDLARVQRFARELAPTVELAICPEIEVGVRDLGALGRIAGFLTRPGIRWPDSAHAPRHRRAGKPPVHHGRQP